MQWNDIREFPYIEYGDGKDFLYSEVKEDMNVVMPSGKSVAVKKGDYLLVDKAGTQVKVLEKAKPIAKVKEKVKDAVYKKETEKAKKTVLEPPKSSVPKVLDVTGKK